MKLSHKQKVKMARKMQTAEEKSRKYQPAGVYHGIFMSAAWEKRKKSIQKRISK